MNKGLKVLSYLGITIACLTLLFSCSENKKVTSDDKDVFKKAQVKDTELKEMKTFLPGEHVLSIPFYKDPTKTRLQYPYYEGYRAVGLSSSSSGEAYIFSGASILYVNNVDVVCEQTATDEYGNKVFSEFGIPIGELGKIEQNITETTKDFGIGEHIISIPVYVNPNESNVQYSFDSFDCYEVVDISTTSYGRFAHIFKGTCVLYVNTKPVRCTVTSKDENGNNVYCDFGSPLIQDNTKTLK